MYNSFLIDIKLWPSTALKHEETIVISVFQVLKDEIEIIDQDKEN
jgi:hypothetical protein